MIPTMICSAQEQVWDQLKQVSISEKLGSAYLFSGPPGCGKEGMAIQFAKLLNCESGKADICKNCPSCIRMKNLQHEKLKLIFPLPTPKKKQDNETGGLDIKDLDMINKAIKKKAQDPFFKIRIPRATRILIQSIRELRKSLYLKSSNTGRKMVLVFDAHLLCVGQGEAANAFLKLLEEPPDNTSIILITDHVELLLPTIISRCQRIGFPKLNDAFIENWFKTKMVRAKDIPLLIGLSRGNFHSAQFFISQSLDELILVIENLIKSINQDDPEKWRKFIQDYSKMAKQDAEKFAFHFMLLKIWYQSANRFQKNMEYPFYNTPLKMSIERYVKKHSSADFPAIVFELEDTMGAIAKNLYMPLVLGNLLLSIQKHLSS
tara:strand:+ start:1666 stop:2793 length:1128 start_codon:yes stop_codon:yes gene_type:complete